MIKWFKEGGGHACWCTIFHPERDCLFALDSQDMASLVFAAPPNTSTVRCVHLRIGMLSFFCNMCGHPL